MTECERLHGMRWIVLVRCAAENAAGNESDMMKKSSVDMEDVFRRKKEAKSVLAKAQTTRDKRSRKPVLDMSLPWAGKF